MQAAVLTRLILQIALAPAAGWHAQTRAKQGPAMQNQAQTFAKHRGAKAGIGAGPTMRRLIAGLALAISLAAPAGARPVLLI